MFSSTEIDTEVAAPYNQACKMDYPSSCSINAVAEADAPQPSTINTFSPAYWQQLDQQIQSASDNVTFEYSNQFRMHESNYDAGQHLPVNSDQLQQPIEEDSVPNLPPSTKRAFHNAMERRRRSKLKVLYSELRSLLPNPNPKRIRKLSIPNTVGQVLKYIPELLNEIEELGLKRDELLTSTNRICNNWAVTSKSCTGPTEQDFTNELAQSPHTALTSSVNVTVNSALGRSEPIITIYACRTGFSFSTLLMVLEKEGLDLLSASTFFSDHIVFHNLHLRMIDTGRCEVDTNLQEKLVAMLSEKSLQSVGHCEVKD